MKITTVRVGMTKNLGNFESKKLEIEAVPEDGQTGDTLLSEVTAYVEQQIGCKAAPLAPAPAAVTSQKASTNSKATPGPTAAGKSGVPVNNGVPGSGSSVATAAAVAAPVKPKRGRPKKADWQKELQYVLDSESLKEMHDRLVTFLKYLDIVPLPDLQTAFEELRKLYPRLNTIEKGTDAQTAGQVVDLCKSINIRLAERQRVEDANVILQEASAA